MEKKQSSVKWLINCITEDQMVKAKSLNEWLEIFEQAKAIHKEEIMKSNRDGVDMVIDKKPYVTGEEYYKETFEGQDNE